MMESSEGKPTDSTSLPPVEVRRGVFAQLTIYEVAEYELEILEHGSPDSIYLNFAIFLLSIAVSFLVSLLTVDVSTRIFIVFVTITAVGSLVGVFLLILWFRNRKSVSVLVAKIRNRLPPVEAFQLSADEAINAVMGDITEEQTETLLAIMEDIEDDDRLP